MKISYASDIHTEFGGLALENSDHADVLVLAGDIFTVADLKIYKMEKRFKEFFESCSKNFPNTVVILGNHEHYHHDFAKTCDVAKQFLSPFCNVHLLERESLNIQDVTFIGGTMWTDCNKSDPQTLYHIKRQMNDFQIITNSDKMTSIREPIYKVDENGYRVMEHGMPQIERYEHRQRISTFSPQDSVEGFDKMFGYIKNVVENDSARKYVVVTHHAPSHACVADHYRHDYLMNGAFRSELDEFVMDHPQIRSWIHGHLHDPVDIKIGETRVLCNPRGYVGYELSANDFRLKTFEV